MSKIVRLAEPRLATIKDLESGVKERVLGSLPTGTSSITSRVRAFTKVIVLLSGLTAATTVPSEEIATAEEETDPERRTAEEKSVVGTMTVAVGVGTSVGAGVGTTVGINTGTAVGARVLMGAVGERVDVGD